MSIFFNFSVTNVGLIANRPFDCRAQLCYRARLSYIDDVFLCHMMNCSKLMMYDHAIFTDRQHSDCSFFMPTFIP